MFKSSCGVVFSFPLAVHLGVESTFQFLLKVKILPPPQDKLCTVQSGLKCQHGYARTRDLGESNSWAWNMLEAQLY